VQVETVEVAYKDSSGITMIKHIFGRLVCGTAIVILLGQHSFVSASILSTVDPGGWDQDEPGGGIFDNLQNVLSALTTAGLNTTGLEFVAGIDDPDTTGSGLGVDFTIAGQGTTSGSWSIDQNDLDLAGGKILAYFSLKANGHWNLWEIMSDTDANAATYTNLWDTDSSGGGLLTPQLNNFATLSHIRFWAVTDPLGPPPPTVPEPVSVAVWSLLAGIVAVISSRPRK
jgi:hypothetical protein